MAYIVYAADPFSFLTGRKWRKTGWIDFAVQGLDLTGHTDPSGLIPAVGLLLFTAAEGNAEDISDKPLNSFLIH